MDKEELIKFWIESSDNDYETMRHLYNSKDYSWALFMGHLVIEKLLKACYVEKIDKNVPFTHDLLRIVAKLGLEVDENRMDKLDEITSFNIKGRYDDYKQNFRKLCTANFTREKINNIEELRKWLKKILVKY